MFILELATLLKVLIRFMDFLVGSQEYVKWRTTSSANGNLNSHLFVSFWFFLSPYCSDQDFKTYIKLEWKVYITFLVSNFKENTFIISYKFGNKCVGYGLNDFEWLILFLVSSSALSYSCWDWSSNFSPYWSD